MNEFAIETQNLTKIYGRRRAVHHLSIRVPTGGIYGFIGPNGAGKTTTMRMLATLLRPTAGSATVLSHPLTDVAAIRPKIGYLPEKTALYERLTVSEYLKVFAYAYGVPVSKSGGILSDVLELVDLSDMEYRIIGKLSRGMKQRVALARCLVHNPDILLLDEPASGLDPCGRLELKELLKELRRLGKTVFISSHVLSELDRICDSVGIIEGGKLLFSGTIVQLREEMGVRREFVMRVAPASAVTALAGLPGIDVVSNDGAEVTFVLGLGASQSDAVAAVVRQGGNVLELIEKKVDLEQLFVEFTRGKVS